MDLFDDIIKEFPLLEERKETIASIAKNKGFQTVDSLKNDNSFAGDGNYYEIFRAVLKTDDFELLATIKTKDKYRSFGNDDEPWNSTLELWENGEKIKEKSYTFWK